MKKKERTKNVVLMQESERNTVDTIVKFMNIGKQESRNGYSYFPHTHLEYEFIYMLAGEVKYNCNDDVFTVSKGDLYFIQPGQKHIEYSDSEYVSFYYIKCLLYNLKGEYEYLAKSPEYQKIKKANGEIKRIFFKIFQETHNKKIGYRQVNECLLTELICEIKRYFYTSEAEHIGGDDRFPEFDYSNHKNEIVNEVVDILKSNISEFYTVKELAACVRISESYLFALFNKVLHLSPIAFMVNLKIEQGKKMLLKTDMTIKGIADYLGFCSPSHFSRAFKDACGVSPKFYKEQHKEI